MTDLDEKAVREAFERNFISRNGLSDEYANSVLRRDLHGGYVDHEVSVAFAEWRAFADSDLVQQMVREAVEREREECVKIVEAWYPEGQRQHDMATKIRQRAEQGGGA